MAKRQLSQRQPVIYVISLAELLTKAGRTGNWSKRRKDITHCDSLPVFGETAFSIDCEEDLAEIERLCLSAVRERYPMAGGNEWFKAPYAATLALVEGALAANQIEYSIRAAPETEIATESLSEMSGDQLDHVIKQFSGQHGIPVTKVIRWLGAERHATTIRRTGFVPAGLADRMERLWKRPILLFNQPPAS